MFQLVDCVGGDRAKRNFVAQNHIQHSRALCYWDSVTHLQKLFNRSCVRLSEIMLVSHYFRICSDMLDLRLQGTLSENIF